MATTEARLRHLFLRGFLKSLGADDVYRRTATTSADRATPKQVRAGLQQLLLRVNRANPFFNGRFDTFLDRVADCSDDDFFRRYAELPVFTKDDYLTAGAAVMDERYQNHLKALELRFSGSAWQLFQRLRGDDFVLPMCTGGTTAEPLIVQMNKEHTFAMLFSFFACWRQMGWSLGQRVLVFYPAGTYNIDDLASFNRLGWLTGFRVLLFSHLDRNAIEGLVFELNAFKPDLLLIFPSPMNIIAQTIRSQGLKLTHQPPMINVSGETFFDCQRKNIASVFPESRLEDSYGSVELGEIAHQSGHGLGIFSHLAYIERSVDETGVSEAVITRLGLSSFPFIRYHMKDVIVPEPGQNSGQGIYGIRWIEGKNTTYLEAEGTGRIYCSFFNQLVNDINARFDDAIVEIKVYERAGSLLDIQLITRDRDSHDQIGQAMHEHLVGRLGNRMRSNISFVDVIDHDYRRKYRPIERNIGTEWAGGVLGHGVPA